MYEIIVPGAPKGKERPRLGKWGVYTPTETRQYENLIKQCFIEKYGYPPPIEGGISIEITAYFEIPASWGRKKKQLAAAGELSAGKKPDADNIAKVVLDALNGYMYSDDKQITHLVIDKQWSTDSGYISVTVKKSSR